MSDVPSISLFSQFLTKALSTIVAIYFLFIKIKTFAYHESIRNNEKIMLGTSDAWLMSLLSSQLSEPAYHSVDFFRFLNEIIIFGLMCPVCSISRKDQTPPQQQRVRAVQKLPSYLPSKLTYKCEALFEHN